MMNRPQSFLNALPLPLEWSMIFPELVWRWIDLNSRILRTGHFVATDIPIVLLVTTKIQTSNTVDSKRSHQMRSNASLWLWLVRAGSIIWFGLQFGNCCLSGRQDVSVLSVASTMSSKSSDSVSERKSWELSCGFRGLSIFYVLQKLSNGHSTKAGFLGPDQLV